MTFHPRTSFLLQSSVEKVSPLASCSCRFRKSSYRKGRLWVSCVTVLCAAETKDECCLSYAGVLMPRNSFPPVLDGVKSASTRRREEVACVALENANNRKVHHEKSRNKNCKTCCLMQLMEPSSYRKLKGPREWLCQVV